jgi:hypothetical protein
LTRYKVPIFFRVHWYSVGCTTRFAHLLSKPALSTLEKTPFLHPLTRVPWLLWPPSLLLLLNLL